MTRAEDLATSEYCMNTQYSYQFEGADGMLKIQDAMKMFRYGFGRIGNIEVESVLKGQPESGDVKYVLVDGSAVLISPGESEPKLDVFISIASESEDRASEIEARVRNDIESIVYIDDRMGYCCE
jgi:phosphomannomutase